VRIALVTAVGGAIGGIESYVDLLGPALAEAGHEVALWYDEEGPPGRPAISLPPGAPAWSAQRMGAETAVRELREWRPDVIFSHRIGPHTTELAMMRIAPVVLFVHAYVGACISGWKSRLSPVRAPCSRPLGWPCLLHFLPRRCGGLNPVTMVRRYALETSNRDLLGQYRAIVTASPHMRDEYLRYDVQPERVHMVDLMIPRVESAEATSVGHSVEPPSETSDVTATSLPHWHLLMVSRLTALKGGHLLLRALPHLRTTYPGPIRVTIAGDGDARPSLEREARRLQDRDDALTIAFAGWVDDAQRERLFREADLLVVPSVWPEPLGLVGPEAGQQGLPAAAFAVGGIPAWLSDGVNGHLAPASPPTAAGLARAITQCLSDRAHLAALRAGAEAMARRFTAERHLAQLLPILAGASREGLLSAS
jgi:glycosyltransferase involved in cell wall biosynthesis